MRASLVLDQFADVDALTEELQPKVVFRPGPGGRPEAVFPLGTEFEGAQAIALCKTGQAMPIDDECAKAVGMTPARLAHLQVEYKMNTLGINRKEDRALYRAGVILGYDEHLNYIKGPKWSEYQAAKVAAATGSDDV